MSRTPERVLRSPLLLKKLMQERGYNCNTLGPQLGRSRQLIAHLTSGRRESCSAETAAALAEELGVNENDLFWPTS